ncbi:unnamed protein product, partial [Rangifer tarandus platyrhynchus]
RHNRLPPTDPPPASSPATQASSKALFQPHQLTKRRFRAYLVNSHPERGQGASRMVAQQRGETEGPSPRQEPVVCYLLPNYP